jgi:hypothetical protein
MADLVQLAEAHRLAQARIGAQTVKELADAWVLLDPTALDASYPLWMRAVSPIVGAARRQSARLAGNYMSLTRSLAGVPGNPVIELAETLEARRLAASMLVTGPRSIQTALSKGVLLNTAMDVAKARAAAAGMRHALNGGRDTIVGSVKRDRLAVGFARSVSPAACAFCKMLQSRGAVYRSEQSAGFASHDGCGCQAVAVWSRGDPLPKGAAENKKLWNESTKDLHGNDALNAFRRAVAAL